MMQNMGGMGGMGGMDAGGDMVSIDNSLKIIQLRHQHVGFSQWLKISLDINHFVTLIEFYDLHGSFFMIDRLYPI